MTRRFIQNSSTKREKRSLVYEPIVSIPLESFVWRCDDYPMPWSVWNHHPECEIHLIRKTAGTCYVGDYISAFKPGDLCLIGRNLPHNWVTPLSAGTVVEKRDIVIQFDEDRLLGSAPFLPELGRLESLVETARRGLSFYGRTREECAALAEAIGQAAGVERLSLLLRLLHLLSTTDEYRVLSSDRFTPNLDTEANRILGIVFRHLATELDKDVRLADMAEMAGMTESSFSRFFKKNTGNTFTRHLSELRTAKACELLANTDKTVTEISQEVGYINISNFNRAFRALRSMTPSRYRRLTQC